MMMMYFSTLLSMLFLLSPSPESKTRTTITVTPQRIRSGDSALLTWSTPGTDSIYISHVGVVPPTGSIAISPKESTTYILVTPSPNGKPSRSSVTLVIIGARDGGEFPGHDERFYYPLAARSPRTALPRLLDRMLTVLQESYRLSVDEYSTTRRAQHVFLTTRGERPDLVDASDRTMGARRISYRITVSTAPEASGTFQYTIETLVQMRKKLVRTWRNEDNPTISTQESMKLRDRINATR
jgi:hypothetical protein